MKTSLHIVLLVACWLASALQLSAQLPALKVSSNGRFLALATEPEKPFFWLGDTDWKLLTIPESDREHYIKTRAAQGFNVLQGPVIINFNKQGMIETEGAGHLPLRNVRDLASRNEEYFVAVDHFVKQAAENGLYVALLPMWAQAMTRYDTAALYEFGVFLGSRYKLHTNVLWVAGGEAAGEARPAQVNALARGLYEGCSGKQLISVHPSGFRSSSEGGYWISANDTGRYAFHREKWLSFNMLQTGQQADRATWQLIAHDLTLSPAKPTFESEYFYEDHPNWTERDKPNPYRATALDVRKGGYWSVFAGGFGYTYGHHAVWQVFEAGKPVSNGTPTIDWRSALHAPGAVQMKHLSALMLSRPYFERIPDGSIVLKNSDITAGGHVEASRDGTKGKNDASYIMVYIPGNQAVEVSTAAIASKILNVWWYSPENGSVLELGMKQKNTGKLVLSPPASWSDAVLVVDDAGKKYSAPGTLNK